MTTRREGVCTLLQKIGLPAVRLKQVSAEVIEYNKLFSFLVDAVPPLDYRLSFVEGILARLSAADRASCEVAIANRVPVQVHVAFESIDGRALDFEMRCFSSMTQKKVDQSIICVFIPFTTPIFDRVCLAHVSEGRELERRRIRNELHEGVSQRLLGAAFGCKVLAGKVGALSEDLGKEASDLADLVNGAVMELQNLVQSSQN